MKVWLVETWVGLNSDTFKVCASEELALAAANKLVAEHGEEVTWKVDYDTIYGTLTYQGDECSAGLIIKCWEVDGG